MEIIGALEQARRRHGLPKTIRVATLADMGDVMPEYRVYPLDACRLARPAQVLVCENDPEAIEKTKRARGISSGAARENATPRRGEGDPAWLCPPAER
jgi:hypothetical protein